MPNQLHIIINYFFKIWPCFPLQSHFPLLPYSYLSTLYPKTPTAHIPHACSPTPLFLSWPFPLLWCCTDVLPEYLAQARPSPGNLPWQQWLDSLEEQFGKSVSVMTSSPVLGFVNASRSKQVWGNWGRPPKLKGDYVLTRRPVTKFVNTDEG